MSKETSEGRTVSGKKIRNSFHSQLIIDTGSGYFHLMERESHKEDILFSFEEAECLVKYITAKLELHERRKR